MATKPPKVQANSARSPRAGNNSVPEAAQARADRAAMAADSILTGGQDIELAGQSNVEIIVRGIARRVATSNQRMTGGNTLETMARMTQDSLLSAPVIVDDNQNRSIKVTDGGRTLKNALDEVDNSAINDLFATEKGRLDDYQTYAQIGDLITQASEAVQTFTDNIVSPDDFTKRDLNVFYDGPDQDGLAAKEVRAKCAELLEKYRLDDRGEEAITKSLTKGDFFMVVLNLRQELETILTEDTATPAPSMIITEQNVPNLEDPDVKALHSLLESEMKQGKDGVTPAVGADTFRVDMAAYLNDLIVINEDTSKMSSQASMSMALAQDIPNRAARRRQPKDGHKTISLEQSKIRGSILKMVPPENVVKLYQDDTVFGYYFVELSGPDIADFARRGTMDQTSMVRAIDQNLSVRALGADAGFAHKGKDALISRIIVKTLSAKLGSSEYLKDHEEFAADAYAILARARRDKRRATFTYVAPDQMIHFTPNGSLKYGESVLSRVKFFAKLYLGAMTNAFMRNSIRRPERLVWYIDIGVDNDGSNAVQNFIRTIKQREVKFSNLKDITTTINQIGEFHDFYIPTYNGERPVEVETLNMGAAAEVDNAYLEYLRKAIIGGMGVPAAFVGYSEEVAFARSLTMDNGRFLRRVIRHQKHYGRSMSQLMQTLWRNEYSTLEELTGVTKDPAKKDDKDKKPDERLEAPVTVESIGIDVSKIFVRYPSPATLNMTNLSDALNAGTPVADFVVETVAAGEDDVVKAELKRQVIRDMMPQVHWDKYEDMLIVAKRVAERAKAVKTPDAAPGGGAPGGDAGGDSMQM